MTIQQWDAHQYIPSTSEECLDRAIAMAVERAIAGGNEMARRRFLQLVGASSAAALIRTVFPLDTAKALAQEHVKGVEKKDLTVAFIPITCATPIIMADPMGFYAKYGSNATARRASGWVVIRDWAINKEVNATHMLSPMPLSITLGVGSPAVPYFMPAVENINGQAITLHIKHKDVQGPQDMKGFRFCVPFDYSMHTYLLRYYLAEGGLHPDKDVQIRVVPPPEMVANLKAGNVDGYLAPDPFNQRAVYENAGFIFMLSKDIWAGNQCCAFAISHAFAKTYPNTFLALFKAIVDATHFASKAENRKAIAEAMAPKNYLNQPVTVLEHTGKYADGLGNIKEVPDRINFDPFPWHSMAVWILTQMQRWKHVDGDLDYKQVAEQVYLAAECDTISRELRYPSHARTSTTHTILGKVFDPRDAAEYARSFAISNLYVRAYGPRSVRTQVVRSEAAAAALSRVARPVCAARASRHHHGIGHLIRYTVTRFAAGFLSASVVAVCLGVLIGLSRLLYQAFNPFIQMLKPISPLAWMPPLLYTVKNPTWTAILVVFLAGLWPTVANTAFGVSTIHKDYLQVASLLQLSWSQRLLRVVLPAAAPALVAGLRISFGSALVAVVPAEMLLGALGVGYLTWTVNLPRPRTREAMIDTDDYTRRRSHILHFLMRGSHALATPEA